MLSRVQSAPDLTQEIQKAKKPVLERADKFSAESLDGEIHDELVDKIAICYTYRSSAKLVNDTALYIVKYLKGIHYRIGEDRCLGSFSSSPCYLLSFG